MQEAGGEAQRGRTQTILINIGLFVCSAVFISCVAWIIIITVQRGSAKSEYKELQEQYGPQASESVGMNEQDRFENIDHVGLAAINPDYIGWIEISGTNISYPVAYDCNNHTYLDHTFSGKSNPTGSIAIDMYNSADFSMPVTFIYGNHRQDKTQFTALTSYLDTGFMANHSNISLALKDGTIIHANVFAARNTDLNDIAFSPFSNKQNSHAEKMESLGAPEGTQRIIVLCTNETSDISKRMIVLAAIVEP